MSQAASKALRALIVDDEAPARRRLARMLGQVPGQPEVTVAAEAADGLEALERLREASFDLAFLDIHMPGVDGLALAKLATLPRFVFVTAHDDRALAAFEVGAVDYLLKPLSQARLDACVERLRQAAAPSPAELEATLARARPEARANADATSATPPRLAVRSGNSTRLFDPSEVGHLWASDKYALFTAEGAEQVVDESLAELELRLAGVGFLRVHRSALVNLARVTALHSEGAALELELEDGTRVPVSRRMASEVKRRLGL